MHVYMCTCSRACVTAVHTSSYGVSVVLQLLPGLEIDNTVFILYCMCKYLSVSGQATNCSRSMLFLKVRLMTVNQCLQVESVTVAL